MLSESDICEILQNFELEISYIEQKYSIAIQTINDEVMDLIKQEAIINYSGPYHFCELVDAITLEYAKNMIVDTFALNDDVGPKVYLEKEFGPLKGKHLANVAVGTSQSYSASTNISISANDDILGYTISAGASESFTYSVSGPSDGATLYSGDLATHRTAIGVLWGTILRYDHTLASGERVSDYYIGPQSTSAVDYTFLTSIGVPTYANRIQHQSTKRFSNQKDLYLWIEQNPGGLL